MCLSFGSVKKMETEELEMQENIVLQVKCFLGALKKNCSCLFHCIKVLCIMEFKSEKNSVGQYYSRRKNKDYKLLLTDGEMKCIAFIPATLGRFISRKHITDFSIIEIKKYHLYSMLNLENSPRDLP